MLICVGCIWNNIFHQMIHFVKKMAQLQWRRGGSQEDFIDYTTGLTVTSRSKITSVFNVKDYGAVGNGIEDDTRAIQNACDDAFSSGQFSRVYVPEGTYQISKPIVLRTNVHLQGAGQRVTEIRGLGTHIVIYIPGDLQNVPNCVGVSKMTIRGGSRLNTSSIGVSSNYVNRGVFEHLEFFQCYIGFYFSNNWQCIARNLQVHGGGNEQSYIGFYGAEVHPQNQNNCLIMSDCVAQGVEKYGFRLINFNGSKFTSCEALDGEIGFYLGAPTTGTERIRWGHFNNCLADTNSDINWRLEKGNASDLEQIAFSNCWAGSAQKGWSVTDGARIVIDCPMVIGNPSLAMTVGIELERCSRITITGANLDNYTIVGINLKDSLYISVTGCQAFTNSVGTKGLVEEGTSNHNIAFSNVFEDGFTSIGAQSKISNTHNIV